MSIITYISAHPMLIFTIVIVAFVLYQILTWYAKGGKEKLNAIAKSFQKEKDKIISGDIVPMTTEQRVDALKKGMEVKNG